MTTELLSVRGMTAGYGNVAAVRDFDLDVRSGEITSVLGPNGAGKTTALLAMVGLLPLMAGSVQALGAPVTTRRPHRTAQRGIRLVPADRGLCFGLTVREHLRMSGRASRERESLVLDHFPALRGLMSRTVGLLSGGEQQMLAIGRAVLSSPRVLLIDEMSLGLAPKIVQSMLPTIRSLATAEGMGVVIVEQHIEMALSASDHAIVLNHGDVRLTGPANDLLNDRARVEAAYFATASSA